ncbi:MAG: type II CAAX prenyl endopeptidase Rce1 family protein [Chitinophagales bacterium]
MTISDNRRYFEIIAVVCTGLLKFVFMEWLDMKLIYIAAAILFWSVYVAFRVKKDKSLLEYWGFSRKNATKTFQTLGILALLSAISFIGIGLVRNTAIISWHIFPVLLIYPLWGIIQQFLMMSLVAGNLKDQTKLQVHPFIIIGLTACLFSVVHLPYVILTIGTFFLAIVYASIFLKYRNLWWLGIFHGWLGAIFYYFVLNRDTFMEVFQATN